MKPQLVILDRDGVINVDSEHYIKSPDEWRALPGSLEAIASLNKANIKVAIATNQSGLARGLFDLTTLQSIHEKLSQQLAHYGAHVDGIFFCPHGPDDGCECRKPKPGLLQQAFHAFSIAPKDAIFIGDSIRDIQAAQAAHCSSALVKTGNGETTLKNHPELNSPIFNDLAHFVENFLGK